MTSRQNIAALGAGRMGRGIAIAFAFAGHEVALVDFKPRDTAAFDKLAADALADIRTTLEMLARVGLLTADEVAPVLERVRVVQEADAAGALRDATVIFEGVPEVVDLKRDALARASRLAGPKPIIASTTSTSLVRDLSSSIARA